MSKVEFHYDRMMDDAVRGVIAQVLRKAMTGGLPGQHHFVITFRTDHPGVDIAPALRERHPHDMTIILQHQFWELNVADDRFTVTLSFNNVPQRLVVPYAAITGFADPSVRWGIKLQPRDVAPEAELSARPEPTAPKDEPSGAAAERGGTATRGKGARGQGAPAAADRFEPAKVVTLESFRRK
ncbi:MAG: SspB family protein [Alphaproteobacteria bacterium]